jgi:hypothetical protein
MKNFGLALIDAKQIRYLLHFDFFQTLLANDR